MNFSKFKGYVICGLILSCMLRGSTSFAGQDREVEGSNSTKKQKITDPILQPLAEKIMLTQAEFEEEVKRNEFLIKMKDNGPLSEREENTIRWAQMDFRTKYSPQINRPIGEFSGTILVVGGGKKFGVAPPNIGITNIERHPIRIEEIPTHLWNGNTEEPLTPEQRESLIESEKRKRQNILDTYYTLNIEDTTEPDLVDSATDLNGVLSSLPTHRFARVFYENVDASVFLNKNAWILAENLCEKGGVIDIQTGSDARRFLPIVLKGSKWEKPVLEQLEHHYSEFKKGRITLQLRNN